MKVAIVMGSTSDLPVVQPAIDILKEFGVEVVVRALSAHRTPAAVADFASAAPGEGIGVIIAAAGKAAHLAGVLAGHSVLPIIGLPVSASQLEGLDALLSTVQMPAGIPVATVAINGGQNAGLLAIQMLSLQDRALQDKLLAFRTRMQENVLKSDAALQAQLVKGGNV